MALKIIFAGTPAFAVPTLQALMNSPHQVVALYTQPDRPAGRGRKLQASPTKELAEQYHIPIQQPENFKNDVAITQIKNYAADVMVVVAYGLLLPQTVLTAPRLGCLNVHASLLPRWRGAAPIQSAILNGDRETGITIMQLVPELDAGDMLKQAAIPIQLADTSETLYQKLSELGAKLLLETLEEIEAGQAHPRPQDKTLVTYAGKIHKSDAEINWQQCATEIERKIRAYYGWPVAFTHWNNEIMRIWLARVTDNKNNLQPGEFCVDKEHLTVGCGVDALQLLQLQMPGKRPLAIIDFINAYRDKMHVNYFR